MTNKPQTTPAPVYRKDALIHATYEKTAFSKSTVATCINLFLEVLAEEISKGNTVVLPEIGIFRTSYRKEFIGSHPVTAEPLHVTAKKHPHLRFCKALRHNVNSLEV